VRADIVLLGRRAQRMCMCSPRSPRLPEPGVRITLATRDLETPYSGMLPGVVAGLYRAEEAHIDLVRLAAATGTRLIHCRGERHRPHQQASRLAGRPADRQRQS
jgi:hypothetical protein